MARRAQSLFRHGNLGPFRQTRRHTESAGRARRQDSPRRDGRLIILCCKRVWHDNAAEYLPLKGAVQEVRRVCLTGEPCDASSMNRRWSLRINEKTGFMLALITPAVLVLALFQIVPILTGANAS